MNTTKMAPGELFLRWLRTLAPVHADLMVGLACQHMPEFTAKWVKEARRLVMDENDEEIEHLCNVIFARIRDKPKCVYCFEEFLNGHELRRHQTKCDDYSFALCHPGTDPYVWPGEEEGT